MHDQTQWSWYANADEKLELYYANEKLELYYVDGRIKLGYDKC